MILLLINMRVCAMCGQEFPEDEMVEEFCVNCASINSDEGGFL